MYHARASPGTMAASIFIYVFGGRGKFHSFVKPIERLNIKTNTFFEVAIKNSNLLQGYNFISFRNPNCN